MHEKFFAVPAEGKIVRDPVTKRQLPSEGSFLPRNSYWTRRLRNGEIKEGAPKVEVTESPRAKKTKGDEQ